MTKIATIDQKRPSLIAKFADRFGVDSDKMLGTLKVTAFKTEKEITNEQMMALLIVADQHGLNPWTREIYAFPDKGGIVPVVGVDGWARIINQHPQFDGMSFEQDDSKCTCTIYRKDRTHPIAVTEYMSECARPNMAPWKSHPNRMLRHKTMIQCARLAFGFSGIFDQDEAERILDAEVERVPNAKPPIQRPRSKSKPDVTPDVPTALTESMRDMIVAKAAEVGVTATEIAEHFGVTSLDELPADKAHAAIDLVNSLSAEHGPA